MTSATRAEFDRIYATAMQTPHGKALHYYQALCVWPFPIDDDDRVLIAAFTERAMRGVMDAMLHILETGQ